MTEKHTYSIAEIAEICKVSKATVSRVINNNPRGVGDETRARILKTIQQLDYRPNALARSVATSRSGMIGVVVPDVSNFFYPKLIRGITDCMDRKGYSLVVANSDYKPKREAEQLLSMVDKRVDGIILCSGVSNKDFLAKFRKYHIPMGLIGRTFDSSLSDISISGDNVKGAMKSVEYLIQSGNRRIVYVEGNPGTSGSRQRMEGYKKAHEQAGLPIRDELMIHGEYSIDYGRQAVVELMKNKVEFDALMTGSDLIAIGIVFQLLESGIRIPEDVEVIGFDNIELASVINPPLSTISKPHYDMAWHVADQLLNVIEGKPVPLSHTVVEPKLVLRATTRNKVDPQIHNES